MKYLPFFLLLIFFSCEQKSTKEEAFNHFIEVYDIYHIDYQTNLKWFDELKPLLIEMQTGYIPDSTRLTSILDKWESGIESHNKSLEKLNKINPINSQNNILLKAKESIEGQILAQNNATGLIELLYDGISPEELEDYKLYAEILQADAKNIERWKDDLKSFRKEFNFSKEDMIILKERYNL